MILTTQRQFQIPRGLSQACHSLTPLTVRDSRCVEYARNTTITTNCTTPQVKFQTSDTSALLAFDARLPYPKKAIVRPYQVRYGCVSGAVKATSGSGTAAAGVSSVGCRWLVDIRARWGRDISREGMSPVDSVRLRAWGSKCSESSDIVDAWTKGPSARTVVAPLSSQCTALPDVPQDSYRLNMETWASRQGYKMSTKQNVGGPLVLRNKAKVS